MIALDWGESFSTGSRPAIAWLTWSLTCALIAAGSIAMFERGAESASLVAATIAVFLVVQVVSIVRFRQYRTLKYFALLVLTCAWSLAYCLDQFRILGVEGYALSTAIYIAAMGFVTTRRGENR